MKYLIPRAGASFKLVPATSDFLATKNTKALCYKLTLCRAEFEKNE